jgi:hypothetical protein
VAELDNVRPAIKAVKVERGAERAMKNRPLAEWKTGESK